MKPQKASVNEAILDNQKTWDRVAHLFKDASALPVWGPFGVGDDLNIMPKIKDQTFLEIGCGSGRSIKHLTENGAKKVYAIDISGKQLEEAGEYNKKAVEGGKVELIQEPMEEKLDIDPVDVVFSVYGIGWTVDPVKTFKNIYSYLKPGGLFIWSWDHTIYTDIQYENGKYVVVYEYHNEKPIKMDNWRESGSPVNITYRKSSTWFQLLLDTGFEIVGYHEPAPKNLNNSKKDPTQHYHIDKAEKLPATVIYVCRKPIK